MAGWVQGNPNLATGEAKVILNEVNSANPSRLNGYVEVAGKKADVVIANPSGIYCKGCGVINAGRTTITTGKAQVENGELKGFEVKGGKVTVSGKGMDNSQSDYTDIIAEKAQLDGGVWSKKGIKVTTGKNKVDRTNDSVIYVGDKNTTENNRTSDTQKAEQQTYAVDVSQLGGIYAEHIYLVDNGSGLGVRNAGHIGASAGNVQIDSHGRVLNSGTVSATQSASINANGTIKNTGKIETKQGNVKLASQRDIEQQGSVVSRQGSIESQAKDKLAQSGESVAKSNIRYQAKQIEVQKGALIAAGVTVQDTAQGEKRSLDKPNSQGAKIELSANTISSQANHIASGEINAQASSIDLTESQSNADRISLKSTSSPLILNNATLYSENRTTLNSPDLISTQQANVNAGHFGVETDKLDNKQGTWIQRGNDVLSLNLKNGLVNTQGKMAIEGVLAIQSPYIQNTQGVLWSNNTLQLNTNTGNIESQSGYLFGKHRLAIQTGTFNQPQGETVGNTLSVVAQQVNNESGKIIAESTANITANQFNNRQGIVYSQGELALNTENLLNQKGILSAVSRAVLSANTLNNLQGVIQNEENLTLSAQALDNTQGDISAKTAVLNVTETNNQQGTISVQDLTLSGKHVDNKGGAIQSANSTLNLTALNNEAENDKGSLISATNRLVLNVANVNNQNTKATQSTPTQGIQAAHLDINADQLDNQSGGVYVGKSANLAIKHTLNNQQGEMLSAGRLDVVNPELSLEVDNTLGQIESVIGTSLQAKTLVNEGTINTKGDLDIALKDSFTLNQAFGVGNHLTFSTKGDFVNNANLVVGNQASIEGATIQNNANAEITSADTHIQAKKLDNLGLIDGETTVVKAEDINNVGNARIYGSHLAIQTNNLHNLEDSEGNAATIAARERLDLGIGNLVNRNHALILSLGNLYIGGKLDENNQATGYSNNIDNGSATIEALGYAWIKTHNLLNHDLHLKLGTKTENEWINEYALGSDTQRYRGGRDGHFNLNNGSRSRRHSDFQLNDGTRIEGFGWKEWRFNRTTTTSTIEHQDPAKILIGDELHLSGENLHNKHSQILIGQKLLLDDNLFTQSTNERLRNTRSTLNNEDILGNIDITDRGTFVQEYRIRKKRKKHYHYHNYSDFTDAHETKHFNFGMGLLKIGEPVASSGATVSEKSDFHGVLLAQKTPLSTDAMDNRVNMEAMLSGVVKNQDNLGIKTHLPEITLPQPSLYKINPDSGKFLVETDPRFTERTQWLSSDYMFKALRSAPQNMMKRLGDGFYEQRLVNEQINQLTGRRFLEGHHSDYAQYQALMDNGVQYAKRWNLLPGVALTAEQMKELTSDMVWMVKREVTLKDGSKTEVLAPQVYVVARNADVDSRGAVISANDVMVNIQGDIKNSGVIAGRNLTHLAANNIENLGGKLQGRALYLKAKETLNHLGGEFNAEEHLVAQAKNINVASRTGETKDTGNFYRKSLSQQASISVGGTDEAGKAQKATALLLATENITVKGANLNIQGDAALQTGNKLNLGTVETQNKEHYVSDADNYYKLDQKQEIGNQFNVSGNVDLTGKSAVEMRGVSLHSDGVVNVQSEGDIHIQAARNQEQLASASKIKSRGLVSSTTERIRHYHHDDLAQGSTLDADKINIQSTNGNVTVQGSNVVAENGLTVQAKNIVIKDAKNRIYRDDFYSKQKSGMLGGGIGVTFGSQKQTSEADQTKLYASGSQVGSLNGNTTMIAEQGYTQTASAVTAVKGDVNILAQKADIQSADDKYETNTKQTFEQKGLTIAITSPILSALQAVQSAVKSTEKVGQSKNDRVNAMAAANSAMGAYRTYQSVGQAAKAASDFMSGAQGVDSMVGVQITYGQQKSESKTHTEGKTAATSQVNAGGKVNIVATGADKDSNININGADISGKQGTHLTADNQVNIQAAEQTHQERSSNKSSGFNVGVAIKVGSGVAAGITVGGNYGKGYGNGDDTSYVASHVGDINSQTTITSGGDTNLIGSQVKGKRVKVTAENLNIESLQDKSTYKGKQMNVSGSVTVGYGVAVGGSYSQSKINADHASVNEQAGIFSGDEGYDIHVNRHTDLKGAIITSTQKAEEEGRNRFSTSTLSHSDIENHSDYSGNSFGVSGSVAANFETPFRENGKAQSGKQAKNEHGQPLYKGEDGKNTTVKNNKPIPAHGWDSLEETHSVGYGSDKESQNSVTRSGISTANVIIRDEAEQLKRTGKTAQETFEAIKTDITTDNAQSQSGKLENHFDKEKVQKELDLQRDVTEEFDRTRQDIKKELYEIADKKRAEAVAIRKNTTGEDGKTGYNTKESLALDSSANKLEKVAFYVDLALGGLQGWGNADITKYVGTAVATDPVVRAATAPEQIWLTTCKQDSLYCSNFNLDGSKRPTENGKAEIGNKRQVFKMTELKPSDSHNVITVSNNGIMNPLDDALKNAIKQNTWETNKEGVAVVYNRPTSNALSELLYAAYDKTNDLLLDLSNHSRGGLTASVAIQNANRNGLANIPVRESRFFGTATNVQDYKKHMTENNGGYSYKDKTEHWQNSDGTVVKSAVHYTDFVGRTPLIGLRSKYIVGGNEPTGGVENTWFTYSHSSYFGEVPEDYLVNDKGQFIDKKGNVVEEKNKVKNDYLEEFNQKWIPAIDNTNPSLPKVVNPK